ncbi:MAG: hypothetical protein ACREQP_08085 [Candidatus Binatia bacterium]
MDFIKMDDPRLDESFSFLFSFKKGDLVEWKDKPSLKGEVTDGVFVGELPAHAGDDVYHKGRTLYQVRFDENECIIAAETEIEKAQRPKYAARASG